MLAFQEIIVSGNFATLSAVVNDIANQAPKLIEGKASKSEMGNWHFTMDRFEETELHMSNPKDDRFRVFSNLAIYDVGNDTSRRRENALMRSFFQSVVRPICCTHRVPVIMTDEYQGPADWYPAATATALHETLAHPVEDRFYSDSWYEFLVGVFEPGNHASIESDCWRLESWLTEDAQLGEVMVDDFMEHYFQGLGLLQVYARKRGALHLERAVK